MRSTENIRARRLAAALSILGLAGCAEVAVKQDVAMPVTLWPAPPEQPRFRYEITLRSPTALGQTEAERLRKQLTGAHDVETAFAKPLGVAARFGRIYVSDTEKRQVVVFDVPRRKTFTFGFRLDGELRKPSGIAVDAQQRVYVADVTARRVVVFDGIGLFLREIGSKEELTRPTGIAVSDDGERIYVVDAGGFGNESHRVVAYDKQGRRLFQLGRRGHAEGEFNYPVDAAIAADGTLYVLDSGNFRVQAFSRDGRFLRSFGSAGNGLGQFARPRGIAIDADGNVYVTDASFGNFQVFNPEGELLLAVGSRGGTEDGPARFTLPAGIAVDETQHVYVVDQYFRKVDVFSRLSDSQGQEILRRAAGR